jgi:hypothetical protein
MYKIETLANHMLVEFEDNFGLKPRFKALKDGAGEQIRTVVTFLEGLGAPSKMGAMAISDCYRRGTEQFRR